MIFAAINFGSCWFFDKIVIRMYYAREITCGVRIRAWI
jgi:hypothetical protein